MSPRSKMFKQFGAALAILNLSVASSLAVAGDNTWTNSSTDFTWNTSSLNWSGAGSVWNNAAGDGAIFGLSGVGPINVSGAINVNSLDFQLNGYTLNGAGSLNFVSGTSTATTGVINVASGTTQINIPISSSATVIQKLGSGVLELSAPMNITTTLALTGNNSLNANVVIGTTAFNGTVNGGTLRVANASVLPSTAKVAIGSSGTVGTTTSPYLDIGSNNVTVAELIFVNQNGSGAWNNTLNANNGVIGTGTLRVTGPINVIGVSSSDTGNAIATPVDLGGGTQMIRTGVLSQFALNRALMFTGPISNGALTKSIGLTVNGTTGSIDGISLIANNTYTGATLLNSGTNVITGTNASTSLTIIGLATPGGSLVSLQGTNGSFLAATTIQAISGGTFLIDNNDATRLSGTNSPLIPSTQNNNRVSDTVAITVKDGNFTYIGASAAAASETYGSLTVAGGHNVLTLTPSGGGSVTLTSAGNLNLDSRATLQVAGTSSSLGVASKAIFQGTIPAAVGGIIPRMTGGSAGTPTDFVFYDPTNGITPLASGSYASSFTTGANVSLAASTATNTVTINAFRQTATQTTTINPGETLTVTSGMLLSTTGTHTIAASGTLDFGSTPGVTYGTQTINSAVKGTQGIINATGTLTLAGDLSQLSGTITVGGTGTVNLNTNTFTGPLEVRRGTLSFGVSQTGTGLSAITMGVSGNDSSMITSVPTLSLSTAGANAVFDRPIIVDNSTLSLGGLAITSSNANGFTAVISPLSNATGSQTLTGNILLNSPLTLNGGAGTGTGSTNFTGTISGPSTFIVRNGRFSLTSTSVLSNDGGLMLGNNGNTMQGTLAGTATGNGPVVISGGNNNILNYAAGSMPGGTITILNASGSTAPSLVPTNNSTLNNTIVLNGDVIFSPGSGVTGVLAGAISGASAFTKNGAGTMVISNNSNTATGAVTVNAGTLAVNGNLAASANSVTVNANGTLGGSGTIARTVTVAASGTLAPGNSPGQLTIDGNLTLAANSSFKVELNGTTLGSGYDNVTVAGLARTVTITNAILSPTTTSGSLLSSDKMFIMVLNDSASTLGTTFAGIAQDGLVSISGVSGGDNYSAQVSYIGDSGSGTLTGGNDIVLYNFAAVPEPTTIAFLGLLGAGAAGGWYYRRHRLAKLMDAKL